VPAVLFLQRRGPRRLHAQGIVHRRGDRGGRPGCDSDRSSAPERAVAVGAQISANGNRFETVYRVIRSPDGGGAGMQDGVLLGATYPVTGTDTMQLFYADGVQRMSDAFTRGAPHTDGVGDITGKGTCTTGSGLHKGEKCTYTITGTYDLNTGVTKLHLAGTFTR
jgi:hypothetical protein